MVDASSERPATPDSWRVRLATLGCAIRAPALAFSGLSTCDAKTLFSEPLNPSGLRPEFGGVLLWRAPTHRSLNDPLVYPACPHT